MLLGNRWSIERFYKSFNRITGLWEDDMALDNPISGVLNRRDLDCVISALEQRRRYWEDVYAGRIKGSNGKLGRKAAKANHEMYTGVLNRFKTAYGLME